MRDVLLIELVLIGYTCVFAAMPDFPPSESESGEEEEEGDVKDVKDEGEAKEVEIKEDVEEASGGAEQEAGGSATCSDKNA